MKSAILTAAGAALLGVSAVAAGGTSDSFEVKLKINKNCTIDTDSIDDLSFADQTFLNDAVDASTSVTVNCTKGTTATVKLSGSSGSRTMSNGTDTIDFDLYKDAARTMAWDSASGVTITGAGVDSSGATLDGSGSAPGTTRTIYGRVPAQSTKSTGDYSATVTATVEF